MVNDIDFGLANKFRDSWTSNHIPYKQDDFHGVGASLFAAINTHLGFGELVFDIYHCHSANNFFPFRILPSG